MVESKVAYKTGRMPNSQSTYENLESYLARIYLSLLPINSGNERNQATYTRVMGILNGFAERYKIQKPEDAVKNPRGKKKEDIKPARDVMSLWRIVSTIDTSYDAVISPLDLAEKNKLQSLIIELFEMYNIANAKNGQVSGFNSKYANKPLASIVNSSDFSSK